MPRKQQDTVLCQICKEQKKRSEAIPAELIRTPIVEIIRKANIDWSPSGYICLTGLNRFRAKYVYFSYLLKHLSFSSISGETVEKGEFGNVGPADASSF